MASKLSGVIPTVKHGGGNVLMWGCMSAAVGGELHFINDIMDSEMLCSILKTKMLPSLLALGRCALFQHNNDPKPHLKPVVALRNHGGSNSVNNLIQLNIFGEF